VGRDDVVLHGYTPEPLTPKATVKGFYQVLFDAFPDCHVDTEAMYVQRDVLTWRFRFSGTHTGTFQGIPPSGRSFSIPGITILRFGANRCVERWSVADFLGMMIQIGAIPAPPAT
jgi:predicted ester cyclase